MVKFGVLFEVRDRILKYYLDELQLQRDYFLKHLIFVMVKCGVLFGVRTKLLNII
jgi:hypothetical protein